MKKEASGLELLRKPFEPHQISLLPKQAKWMTDKKNEYINCTVCGGWHHPKAVHLNYVGHAALTDRLLDCDLNWHWEPMAINQNGSPALDQNGGMWIKLTVCGVTRYGYGHPDGKQGGDAIKETIGDALRNAAMRFGAALDLWHKGDLHALDQGEEKTKEVELHGKKIRVGASPVADGNHRSGSKEVNKMVDDALLALNNTSDLEGLAAVYKHQFKICREAGAHPDQLDIITQQKDVLKVKFENMELEGAFKDKVNPLDGG